MPGTRFRYNGVTFENCHTSHVEEVPEWDSTNMVRMFVRKKISVRSIIHTSADTIIHGVLPIAANTCQAFRSMSEALSEPRKDLYFGVGDTAIITATAAVDGSQSFDGVDLDNGPRPGALMIEKIINSKTIEVSFSITVALLNCGNSSNASGVLSNTVAIDDTMDQNFNVTRTWDFITRLATNRFFPGLGPHGFRDYATPKLEKGFYVERIVRASTADGLTLRTTIVHKQTSNAPPYPATTWTGTHTFRTDVYKKTFEDVSIHLEGPEGGPEMKRKLLALAANVALAKTKVGPTSDGGKRVLQMQLVDHMHLNAVDIQIQLECVGPNLTFAALTLNGAFGRPLDIPGYDRLECMTPGLFGTATPAGLFALYLQSACDDNHRPPDSGDERESRRTERGTGNVPVESYEGTVTQITATKADPPEALVKMHTLYTASSEFIINTNVIQAAIARASSASQNQDTCVFIPVAKPTARRVFRLHAERIGAWPDVPANVAFEDSGIRYVPIKDSKMTAAVPASTASGDDDNKLHALQLEYVFGMSRAPTYQDKLRVGSMPWQFMSEAETSFPANTINPADYA